jgi:hypothetical protein
LPLESVFTVVVTAAGKCRARAAMGVDGERDRNAHNIVGAPCVRWIVSGENTPFRGDTWLFPAVMVAVSRVRVPQTSTVSAPGHCNTAPEFPLGFLS